MPEGKIVARVAPLALAAIKEATRRVTLPAALRDAEDIILPRYLSSGFQEGLRAFLDRRKRNGQRPLTRRVVRLAPAGFF